MIGDYARVARTMAKELAPLRRAVSHGGAEVGFSFGGPHGAIAVGDLSLDHAGAEFALRGVVGGIDLAGKVAEGEKLVSRTPDLGGQFSGEIASGG